MGRFRPRTFTGSPRMTARQRRQALLAIEQQARRAVRVRLLADRKLLHRHVLVRLPQ